MLAASHRVRWRSVFRLSPAPKIGIRRYAGLDFLKNALVPFPIDFVGDVPKADENLIGGFRDAGNMIAVREKFRSEEHTSELQSLMRISYAVFCLKKKN